jgi:hypothetical protein
LIDTVENEICKGHTKHWIEMEHNISDEWDMEVFPDSECTGDRDSRKPVSGHMIFVCNDTCMQEKVKVKQPLS